MPDNFGQTEMGGRNQRFHTTCWTEIIKVRTQNEVHQRRILNELIQQCWKPVYCYLRRRGYANAEAKDLTQAFFHEIVLGKELIQQADRAKGRFRSFLLTALHNYLVNVQDKAHALKRVPKGQLISLDMVDEEVLPMAAEDLSPEDCFNHVWISSLLEQTLHDVETSCYEDGKTVHWKVFEARVLQPILEETGPHAIKDLCAQYNISDGGTLANMVVTVKRRIRAALEKRIRDSVESPDEADQELQDMARFLPRLAQNVT